MEVSRRIIFMCLYALVFSVVSICNISSYSVCHASSGNLFSTNNFFLMNAMSFLIGVFVTEIIMGVSASIVFGLFDSQVDFQRGTGPFGLIGICMGFLYFVICTLLTIGISWFLGPAPYIEGVATAFKYASWITLLRVLVDRRSVKQIGFGTLFGYIIIYVSYGFLFT